MTRVVLFGATGMVGQGVLREALLDGNITSILSIGRRPSGKEDPKLSEVILKDPSDLSSLGGQITGIDACLYCLGTSAMGMSEKEYTVITKEMTLKVADSLLSANPAMRFLFVSGDRTDARSRTMWARVKGETENELMARSPAGAFMFRPGLIEPMHGIQGQRSLPYRAAYAAAPLLRCLRLPITNTEALGRALLQIAKGGAAAASAAGAAGKHIFDNADINRLAASAALTGAV
ncbi:hypothetical protein VOLCADRAFT_107998 [Volvox carteri f. nagariensis]|uniref:NAD-dependent epimerase/dehydratase domain-containing protein n=1 Tax=Volvox carteri f. nagariensis TaxID=3068 RepID=D8UHN0_VOLCA|nr:uncharacterized protein VOLCADRAFT_107998 [Volvox carteri f. nagariensis]EFJ40776.1 hypothetical protein VOLCADRAFT_107998 [Volvox carteri f. nagariensis]|eukprot:XP_002958151.1 hypothetical protein VOLCADRAFT_107998 [Volvox carteri f. nagariensis]